MAEPDALIDDIGPWTEIKLEIIRKYAAAYSTILAKQPYLNHIYVDAFAASGLLRSRETGELVEGSPLVALNVKPEFSEYHLIELSRSKVSLLRTVVEGRPNVFVYPGDCNDTLMNTILPRCRYEDYKRALWLLDPYGLHYRWSVVEAAGKARSIEVLLNFPIMDINRTVGQRNPAGVSGRYKDRMTAFWGDDSWQAIVHSADGSLFEEFPQKSPGSRIVEAYCQRLKKVATFPYVAKPLLFAAPANNTPLYYIVFASHNRAGYNIASDILRRYRAASPQTLHLEE